MDFHGKFKEDKSEFLYKLGVCSRLSPRVWGDAQGRLKSETSTEAKM